MVISSSHAVAKGALVGPDQLHLCMCYSPIRYAWDLQHQYLREAGLDRGLDGWLARWMLHKIRLWDTRTANSVDAFMAISHFIARRIEKAYRRDAAVIYPPVDVSGFTLRAEKEDFYLTASRMVPYKKMPMIVQAFSNMRDKRLVVIGDGPEFAKCKALAASNVELLGYQPVEVLRDYMQRAKAFVFAAEEDFGIAPLEAQACGTPVIAYGKGGVLETVVGADDMTGKGMTPLSPTGLFFAEQTVSAVVEAVRRFEVIQGRFEPEACRKNVLRFAPSRFREEFSSFVEKSWTRFQAGERVDGWWLRQ